MNPTRIFGALLVLAVCHIDDGVRAGVCVDTAFLHCQQLFNNELHIADDSDWSNPVVLAQVLQNITVDGEAGRGLIDVCRAFNNFRACLGGTESDCVSVHFLVEQGMTPRNAIEFVGVFKSYHYLCGAGLFSALQKWDCIAQTLKEMGGTTLMQCLNSFYSDVQQNPQRACEYADVYLKCYSGPFKDRCDSTGAWVECELLRNYLSVEFYQCQLACPTSNAFYST